MAPHKANEPYMPDAPEALSASEVLKHLGVSARKGLAEEKAAKQHTKRRHQEMIALAAVAPMTVKRRNQIR